MYDIMRSPAASAMPGNGSHPELRSLPSLQGVDLHGQLLTDPSLLPSLLFLFPAGICDDNIISDLSMYVPCSVPPLPLSTLDPLESGSSFSPHLLCDPQPRKLIAKTINLAALFTSNSRLEYL